MTSKKVAVIGAGPAGLTAAYQISKQGIPVDVYEAGDGFGGLAKTIELWDCMVDIGPHRFFSDDTRVNELWLEVVGHDYEMVDRLTRIYYKNKFFYYPLKAFNALERLGLFEAAHCMLSYIGEKISPTKPGGDFESWVTSRFGRRLYEIFFKTYSEKLWGIPCTELDADFAAQRIKKLSLYEAIKNALLQGKGNKHKTLVDQFAYPTYGTGMVYNRMADLIRKNGGNTFTKTPVKKVLLEDGVAKALVLMNGEEKAYSHIISSMPLTLLVKNLDGTPEEIIKNNEKLRYRNTIIVYLKVEGKDLFPDNWLYVHSNDVQTGRITNFRNWVPQLYGDKEFSILALEYWCYDEDEFWSKPESELIEIARKELQYTKLAGKSAVTDGFVYKIPRCYPVYNLGYKEVLKPVEDYLSSIKNLYPIGRYGAFKYNNQDHSILMGLLAAENVANDANHNLWNINTDYESYQESSVITKTGLSKK